MHLYNLTLSTPSTVACAALGQFSGTRTQEIVLARGSSHLVLLRPDTATGRIRTVLEQHTFGLIRALSAFRLTGGTRDYLVVGSDSGKISILEYDAARNTFVVVHSEPFGRSGVRRIVPGQFLAADPKGRAVMIAAIEKSKLVYVLNRDAAANLTISSPLEAHKPNAIIHSICAVDVGFDNPLFAALELDYEDADRDPTGQAYERAEKMLTYYELDLGLNHVVRKWSTPVERRANMIIQVPGGFNQNTDRWEGPSGVLVCSEGFVTYVHQGADSHRLPIPRRHNPFEKKEAEQGQIIIASVCHRMKNAFFFLLQTESGDLFKLTMDHDGEDLVSMRIKYFDTVPPAAALCIFRAGFLFVASEFGSQHFYSFQKLGDDDDIPEYASRDLPALGMTEARPAAPRFTPRPLDNLVQTDEINALDPILDAKVLNALQGAPAAAGGSADTPQIFTACGRGPRSSLRMLRHGLEVVEVVSSDLPGVPNNVWATRLRKSDEHDSYIVLSFVNGTLVLSIGEVIEEVPEATSGFLTSAPTLAVQQLGEDGLLQVHLHGIRHIMPDSQVTEWNTPPDPRTGEPTSIVATSTNERQVIVALSSNELVYFEMDMEGQLNEYQERRSTGGARVLALSMASVPPGRQRTPYVAVGCDDQTVRILSLDPDSTLQNLSLQVLTALPSSICMAEMRDAAVDRNHLTLFVNIGLVNGVLLRTVLDPISGQLTDTRTRFLGSKPVKLTRVSLSSAAAASSSGAGQQQSSSAGSHMMEAVLAISSKTWLSYTFADRVQFSPLIYEPLDHVWSFSAELCPEGLIGVIGGTLRIFTIADLGTKLKQDILPLSYTPRKIAPHPSRPGRFFVVESDHRVLSPWSQQQRLQGTQNGAGSGSKGSTNGASKAAMDVLELDPAQFGHVSGEAGQWASCIRCVNMVEQRGSTSTDAALTAVGTTWKFELEENEAAFSVGVIPLSSHAGDGSLEHYVVVGSGQNVSLAPRACSKAFLRTYRMLDEGARLELVHRTEVEDVPLALTPFGGRLLCGVGKALRIYDMGKKKLLRKCETKAIPTAIVSLTTQGTRIVIGDLQESVFFATYKPLENRLIVFADDVIPRWMTTHAMLDYETYVGGDKFGNIVIARLAEADLSAKVDEDPTGLTVMHEKAYLHGAAHRTKVEAHFHLGEVVTSLSVTSLVSGGREVVVYTTLSGGIGVLVPFVSKEDVEMLSSLEMHLRSQTSANESSSSSSSTAVTVTGPSVLGRDHLTFRSVYVPVRNVVDGDLCETYGTLLAPSRQLGIAQELDERTPAEINKKLDQLRPF
ncbi:pre-mRNA-splicing factor rse1 [Tilletia horrida]|uniref:Pre-mRNA-splicing factor rse1 n=1 Tax=Tilletia horrida TaxID=155126 RepID=A0AAN6GKM3_9BASI|nr:pre-mRNA-splicing factor rse1 [Tilletia horrida]